MEYRVNRWNDTIFICSHSPFLGKKERERSGINENTLSYMLGLTFGSLKGPGRFLPLSNSLPAFLAVKDIHYTQNEVVHWKHLEPTLLHRYVGNERVILFRSNRPFPAERIDSAWIIKKRKIPEGNYSGNYDLNSFLNKPYLWGRARIKSTFLCLLHPDLRICIINHLRN